MKAITKHHWLILSVLYLAVTIPFLSHWPFNWDAAQFTLGVTHFSIHMHQPHPPGYPIFILVGKTLAVIMAPHTALVLESMVFGLGAVLGMYSLILAVWKKPWLAMAVSLLWLVNPLFWLYRETALTYSIDACVSVILAYFTWLSVQTHQPRYVYLSVGVLAIAAGFRPSLAVLFLPMVAWQYLLHIRHRQWRLLLRASGIGISIVLAWLIPLVIAADGLDQYRIDSANLYTLSAANASIFAGANWQLTWQQTIYVFTTLFEAYNVVTIFIVIGAVLVVRQRSYAMMWWMVVWSLPSLLIYCLVHFGQLGYALTIMPIGYVLCAPVLLALVKRAPAWQPYIYVGIGSLVLLHASVFLVFSPDYTHPEYVPVTRVDMWLQKLARNYSNLFKMNATLIQRNDDRLEAYHDLITKYDPATTVVVAARNIAYPATNGLPIRNDELFRELSAIIPNYQVVEVAPNRRYFLQAQASAMSTVKTTTVTVPNDTQYVIFALNMLPSSSQPTGLQLERQALSAGATSYYIGDMTQSFTFAGFTFKRPMDL